LGKRECPPVGFDVAHVASRLQRVRADRRELADDEEAALADVDHLVECPRSLDRALGRPSSARADDPPFRVLLGACSPGADPC
jgi:hypothetical protein